MLNQKINYVLRLQAAQSQLRMRDGRRDRPRLRLVEAGPLAPLARLAPDAARAPHGAVTARARPRFLEQLLLRFRRRVEVREAGGKATAGGLVREVTIGRTDILLSVRAEGHRDTVPVVHTAPMRIPVGLRRAAEAKSENTSVSVRAEINRREQQVCPWLCGGPMYLCAPGLHVPGRVEGLRREG